MSNRFQIEGMFEQLFRGVTEPYAALRPNGPEFTIVAVNDAFERVTGRSRDELEGRGFFEVFAVGVGSSDSGEQAVPSLNMLRQSLVHVSQEGGSEGVGAFRWDLPIHRRASGDSIERWWSSKNTAIVDDGEVTCILHRLEEITNACTQRANETSHRREPPPQRLGGDDAEAMAVESPRAIAERSRQQFYDLFMNAPALIAILTGPDHVYTLNNPAHDKLLGHRKLVGRTVSEVFDKEISHDAIAHLDTVYETGEIYSAEETSIKVADPDTGEVREHFVTLAYLPTHDLNGAIDGVVVFGWDVTEMVESRLIVESQANQLRQESKLKDEFLAMLGHELRNPLAPLATVGQILSMQDGGLDPERVDWAASIIERQIGQLSGLVDDLLDVARISEGRIELEPGRCELDDLLTSAVESVEPLVERNQQDLEVCRPAGKVVLAVDKTRLVQVISNLLHNATKYTPERGKIRLEAAVDGEELVITVEDTGVGINAEVLPHVFDLFRQSDTSLSRPRGGLGLGLTLVRRLVEMHGGSVRAMSDGPGKGSRFEVRLPMVYSAKAHRSREPRPEKSG